MDQDSQGRFVTSPATAICWRKWLDSKNLNFLQQEISMHEDLTAEPTDSWKNMPVELLVRTLFFLAWGSISTSIIANSAITGIKYLTIPLVLAFGVFAITAALSMFLFLILEAITAILANHVSKGRVYFYARWFAFVVGSSSSVYFGAIKTMEGLRENRLVAPSTLYARCMAPATRTVEETFEECADGWNSPSIGEKGACSHHGGVVRRIITREETYQPRGSDFCRADASNRSWLD